VSQTIRWSVRRKRGVWEGEIIIPTRNHGGPPMPVTVKAEANEKKQAVTRAAAFASTLAENPAVQAVLPPGGAAALKLLGKAAASATARRAARGAANVFRKVF